MKRLLYLICAMLLLVSGCGGRGTQDWGSFTPDKAYSHDGTLYAVQGTRESGTHNLWIQSGDTGTVCYTYKDGGWEPDPSAVRPEDIVSKYD